LFCEEVCNIPLRDAILGLFTGGIELISPREVAALDIEPNGSGLDFQNLGDLGNGEVCGFTHKHLGFLGKGGKHGMDVRYHEWGRESRVLGEFWENCQGCLAEF
jgi:hypothetical protein